MKNNFLCLFICLSVFAILVGCSSPEELNNYGTITIDDEELIIRSAEIYHGDYYKALFLSYGDGTQMFEVDLREDYIGEEHTIGIDDFDYYHEYLSYIVDRFNDDWYYFDGYHGDVKSGTICVEDKGNDTWKVDIDVVLISQSDNTTQIPFTINFEGPVTESHAYD